MTDSEIEANPFEPDRIPARLRTAAYVTSVVTGAVSFAATGVAAVWFPDLAEAVMATGGVLTGTVAILAGGVGVVYRPTR